MKGFLEWLMLVVALTILSAAMGSVGIWLLAMAFSVVWGLWRIAE